MEAEVKSYLRFARRLYSTIRFALVARLAGRMLRRLVEGASTSRNVVGLAFGFRFRDPIASFILGCDVYIGIKPAQVYEEILRLAGIVAELKPRRVLETLMPATLRSLMALPLELHPLNSFRLARKCRILRRVDSFAYRDMCIAEGLRRSPQRIACKIFPRFRIAMEGPCLAINNQ